MRPSLVETPRRDMQGPNLIESSSLMVQIQGSGPPETKNSQLLR
jgi:hypothetical protein